MTLDPIAAIYREHREALERYIAGRVRWSEEAEDILQDVFYSLARLDPVTRPVENIAAWLYAAARNRIIDRSRKQREERLPDDAIEEITDLFDDSAPLPAMLRSLFWEILRAALEELPDSQRSVFELTEIDGFTFKEISDSTGIPINTLLSRKHRAVTHLRRRLQSLYSEIIER